MSLQGRSLALMLATSGCFSPEVDRDTEVETASGTSPGESTSTSASAAASDGPGTDAASNSTESGSPPESSDTSGPAPTTAGESTETGTVETTGTDPFCGDGIVDEDEECDEGLESNALDGACLPDCNLNVCGDSNVGPDEACDEGADDNVLEPGACAPDCSGVIESRLLLVSDFAIAQEDGNFGPNPLAAADSMCPSGYRALLTIPGQRQVTNSPNQADAVVDWPLRPFTAYFNADDGLVWITDATPILGVRDGIPAPLVSPIDGGGPFAVTGMNQDWTANTAENCSGFSSSSSTLDLRYAVLNSETAFLSGAFTTPCNETAAQVICVEQ